MIAPISFAEHICRLTGQLLSPWWLAKNREIVSVIADIRSATLKTIFSVKRLRILTRQLLIESHEEIAEFLTGYRLAA